MAWPKEKKELTRQKIVETAARLFMRYGYEEIGIEDIMSEASLTRGGFYHYFRSKSDLYYEAILTCVEQGKTFMAGVNRDNLADFIEYYLSDNHYNGAPVCPLSLITADITRRNDTVRAAYDRAFNAFVTGVRRKSYDEKNQTQLSERQALKIATALIGSMTLARAIGDPKRVREILAIGRENALTILKNKGEPDQ